MSAIETHRSYAVGGIHGVVSKLMAMLNDWSDSRVTRRELGRLTDRELDDIGLSRSDIARIARF